MLKVNTPILSLESALRDRIREQVFGIDEIEWAILTVNEETHALLALDIHGVKNYLNELCHLGFIRGLRYSGVLSGDDMRSDREPTIMRMSSDSRLHLKTHIQQMVADITGCSMQEIQFCFSRNAYCRQKTLAELRGSLNTDQFGDGQRFDGLLWSAQLSPSCEDGRMVHATTVLAQDGWVTAILDYRVSAEWPGALFTVHGTSDSGFLYTPLSPSLPFYPKCKRNLPSNGD